MGGGLRQYVGADPPDTVMKRSCIRCRGTGKGYIYAIINEELKIGVYLGYDPKALPVGNQWKMLGQQDLYRGHGTVEYI